MHYYKRNIGDYAKKAGRLSMLQHGSYTLLIDACYDREKFPTRQDAIEWTWASTKEEIEAVDFVLSKFFVLEDGVYVQKRIQEEIDDYHEKAATNQRIAQERETKRKTKSTVRAHHVDEAPPNHKPLTNNQEPLTSNQEPKKPVNPIVEQNQLDIVREIFAYWQKVMKSPNSKLDDKRIAIIKKALKNYSPRDLCIAIIGCSKTPHNMGQNKQTTKYNGVDLIFRSGDNIDRFIRNASGNATAATETIDQTNERVLREFLQEGTQSDPLTLEMEKT